MQKVNGRNRKRNKLKSLHCVCSDTKWFLTRREADWSSNWLIEQGQQCVINSGEHVNWSLKHQKNFDSWNAIQIHHSGIYYSQKVDFQRVGIFMWTLWIIIIIHAPDCIGKMLPLKNCKIFQIELVFFMLKIFHIIYSWIPKKNVFSSTDSFSNVSTGYCGLFFVSISGSKHQI